MDNIIQTADNLVKCFNTRNPFELVNCLNIEVMYGNLLNLKEFYKCMYRNRFIAISENLGLLDKTVTLMHEIGHDQLHRSLCKTLQLEDYTLYGSISKPEREANLFTAQILIEDNAFLDCAASGYTYSRIASELFVHDELVLLKAEIMNKKGHSFKPSYTPSSTYLAASKSSGLKVAEDNADYITY